MRCNCDRNESCPVCCCEIDIKPDADKCTIKDLHCVLKVGHDVQKACMGSYNLYLINLVIKNCTDLTLTNFNVQLSLGCSLVDLPIIKATDCPQTSPPDLCPPSSTNCVGIVPLEKDNFDCLVLRPCIDAQPYVTNPLWNGICETRLLSTKGNGNLRLPPGESCVSVRFFVPNTATLMSPCVTVSASVPCCGPIRVVKMLNADCPPCLIDKTCACFVDLEPCLLELE